MKKSLSKPPKGGISKQAAQVARGLASSASVDPLKTSSSVDGPLKFVNDREHQLRMKQFEDEIMGETGGDGEGKKSEVMERNLNQMVEVLRMRLNSLEGTSKLRMHLLDEDQNANSVECSEQAPKITDEFDDINPKAFKEPKFAGGAGTVHRENLITVAADKVFIDANRLVLRTKPVTEAGKKLEVELEESFGTSNLRDLKGKKAKPGLSRTEKSKKTEQQKFEAKKAARMKLEKDLQSNVENFLTRSVMDPEVYFLAPGVTGPVRNKRKSAEFLLNQSTAESIEGSDVKEGDLAAATAGSFVGSEYIPSVEPLDPDCIDPVHWPITVKWSSNDPRSKHPDNIDGEMDPGLLLRYAVERINLPSGENMFRWLVRQTMIQNYFVCLFWLTKTKFFDKDSSPENEKFLLHYMSAEYVKIVELLARRAHAEYEKDFVYKYLPFILTKATFFAFFFLCPGSRHLYSKGFKKTILMQTVKVMYGIQLCTATVKVQWAKLFPEDFHEGEEDLEEGGESFPVQISYTDPGKYAEKVPEKTQSLTYHYQQSSAAENGAGAGASSYRARGGVLTDSQAQIHTHTTTYTYAPPADLFDTSDRDFNDEDGALGLGIASRSMDNSYEDGHSSTPGTHLQSHHSDSQHSEHHSSSNHSSNPNRAYRHIPMRKTNQSVGIGQATFQEHPGKAIADRKVQEDISRALTKLSTSGKLDSLTASAGGVSGVPHRKSNRLTPLLAQNLKKSIMSRAEALKMGMARVASGADLQHRFEHGDTSSAQAQLDATASGLGLGLSNAEGDEAGYYTKEDDATADKESSIATSTVVTTTRGGESATLPPRPPDYKTQEFTSFIALQAQASSGNPLTRTVLKPIPARPRKINPLTHRQMVEGLDAKSMSPLIHTFLDTEAASGHLNPQIMRRTVPVNWCVAGGSDTYKKRQIPKELYEEMSLKASKSEKEFQAASMKGHADRIRSVQQTKKQCESVLKSAEPSAVSRFCLDIVRNQRSKVRGGGPGKDFIYSQPMGLNGAPSADDLLLADENLDDDLDEFLASI